MNTNNRILIVDDNPAIHADFKKILEAKESPESSLGDLFLAGEASSSTGCDYQLTSAHQGKEGVKIAADAFASDEPFALAFVDMRMPPGWDGLKTIKELWKTDNKLQIVICTAYSDHSWRDLQNELGKTDNLLILKKPFDSAEVSQMAVALTEKWRLQRELESALEQALVANEAKSRFVATMSHELRTPLNGMLGMAQLLATTELTDQQNSYLSACRTSGESLLNVIGDILDFSKIEAGHLELELVSTDLFDLLEGVTQSVGTGLIKTRPEVDLTCFVDPTIPANVIADVGKLRQVLFNFIGNAAKFTETGSIAVAAKANSVTESDVSITFTIRDTGIGISKTQLETIFEPFHQADNSLTRRHEGTGLGLSICRKFLKLMGADSIGVNSNVDEGSEFSFTLSFDRSDVHDNTQSIRAQREGTIVGTVGLSRAVESNINKLLRGCGWQVEPIFMQRSDDPIPDLSNNEFIFVDYGDDVGVLQSFLSRIEQCKTHPSLSIIPVATAGRELDEQKLQKLGLSTLLTKPISQSHVFRALQIENACSNLAGQPTTFQGTIPKPSQFGLDRPIRVLLVEDNEINQMFAESLFDAANFEFATSSNGKHAIDLLQHDDDFDIIFMDCQMPEMDGFEATSAITQMAIAGQIKTIPIVALTANAVSETKAKCFEVGMTEYLTKPFVIEDLFDVVKRCLDASYSI